jgi:hypothetical protein
MLLYKKIKIPNFEIISEEIITLVQPQIFQNLRFWDLPIESFLRHTPVFFKYLITNFSRFPLIYRFYNTPPYEGLRPHIDNVENASNKIALNIPLLGTKNTTMDYYTTDKDNFNLRYTEGFKHLPVQILKDDTNVTLIDSIELDNPALVRTDVVHGVRNNNNSYRLSMSMKFESDNFDDIFKILPEDASL